MSAAINKRQNEGMTWLRLSQQQTTALMGTTWFSSFRITCLFCMYVCAYLCVCVFCPTMNPQRIKSCKNKVFFVFVLSNNELMSHHGKTMTLSHTCYRPCTYNRTIWKMKSKKFVLVSYSSETGFSTIQLGSRPKWFLLFCPLINLCLTISHKDDWILAQPCK